MSSYTAADLRIPYCVDMEDTALHHHIEDHYNLLRRNSEVKRLANHIFFRYRKQPLRMLMQLGLDEQYLVLLAIFNKIQFSQPLQEHQQSVLIPSTNVMDVVLETYAVSASG